MTWNLEQGWTPHPEGKTGCSAQPPQKNNILSLPHSMLKTVGHWRDKNDTWVTWRGEKIHIFISRLQININHLILQQAFIAFYIFYFHAAPPAPQICAHTLPCPVHIRFRSRWKLKPIWLCDVGRTIWHQDRKNGQFGTEKASGQFGTNIVKMDNLAPRQFGTNIIKRTI